MNRTLSHLPALKSYFASHKDVEKTGKVKSIQDRLHDPMTSLILNFLAFILPHINRFKVIFQTEQCVIGDLLPEMDRLLRTFIVKFVQMRCVKSYLNLKEVDFKTRENQHQDDKLAVGMNARSLFDDAVAKSITPTIEPKFFASVRAFYVAAVQKMPQKFPFSDRVLKDLVILNHRKREDLEYSHAVCLVERFHLDID